MHYEQIEPCDQLKPYVKCFGLLQSNGDASCIDKFKIIADGCPGLIFQQKADAFTDGYGNTFPNLYLHGLTTSHSENTARGNYSNLIVHLYPHALRAIFGLPAFELTNNFAALSDIVANNLTEQLLQSDSINEKIALLTKSLINLSLKNADNSQSKLAYIIRKIKTAENDFSLSDLCSDLGLSQRSLERMIKAHVGVSPKLFFRILRFQNGLDILRREKTISFTQVAFESNYFDQSHHIRDFKEFTGSTPREFIHNADERIANYPKWRI